MRRAHGFDQIVADIRHLLALEPIADRAPLQRRRQNRNSATRNSPPSCTGGVSSSSAACSSAAICGRAPDASANGPPEFGFEVRNEREPQAIAHRIRAFGSSHLRDSATRVLVDISINLLPPDAQQRPQHRQLRATNQMRRTFLHRAQSGSTRAAKKINQERLHQVIRVMAEKNSRTAATLRHPDEKRIPRRARCGFDRETFSRAPTPAHRTRLLQRSIPHARPARAQSAHPPSRRVRASRGRDGKR